MSNTEPSNIKNKIRREEVHHRIKVEKSKEKRKMRFDRAKDEDENPELKKERLKNNVPKTLENTREFDETVVQDDTEVAEEEATDEFAEYFQGNVAPKILVTTSKRPSVVCYEFAAELLSIFPNAEFVKRNGLFEIKHMVQFCNNREYTDIMIVNEDRKKPNAITLIHLPEGPTAYFKLTSIKTSDEIKGHGRVTAHKPELILNNFSTRLGHTVGRMFTTLFPHVPEFQGRQVVTFHNQRDFIFVRRHRYEFRSTEKVGLQEIGPRFTLKLKWLQKGTYQRDGQYEWVFKPEMETSRRRFFL